jgi:hypothetical protein
MRILRDFFDRFFQTDIRLPVVYAIVSLGLFTNEGHSFTRTSSEQQG